jgi:hypothetical protein
MLTTATCNKHCKDCGALIPKGTTFSYNRYTGSLCLVCALPAKTPQHLTLLKRTLKLAEDTKGLIVLIILFCCYTLSTSAQIATIIALETGYENKAQALYNPHDNSQILYYNDWLENTAITKISIDCMYKGLTAYTDIKTYIMPNHLLSYKPIQTEYKIGIGYDFQEIPVYIKIEHMCSHSIDTRIFRESYTLITARVILLNTTKQ